MKSRNIVKSKRFKLLNAFSFDRMHWYDTWFVSLFRVVILFIACKLCFYNVDSDNLLDYEIRMACGNYFVYTSPFIIDSGIKLIDIMKTKYVINKFYFFCMFLFSTITSGRSIIVAVSSTQSMQEYNLLKYFATLILIIISVDTLLFFISEAISFENSENKEDGKPVDDQRLNRFMQKAKVSTTTERKTDI